MAERKRLFLDMDGVLVDFESGLARIDPEIVAAYGKDRDRIPGLFGLMDPLPGALEAFHALVPVFEVHLLSTAPWGNPSAWSDKLLWVQRHLGEAGYKRLTLTHNKHLAIGDFLVDDRTANGADRFTGEHLLFGGPDFPDWKTTLPYLLARA